MIHKIGTSAEPSKEHKAKWGGFNDRPEGLREATQDEIAKGHFLDRSPDMLEYRQMHHPTNHNGWPLQPIWLYFLWDNTGYGITYDYWKGTIQWWLFGCEHEWGGELTAQEKSYLTANTHHPYKCKKCGHFHYTDSSD